MFELPQAATAAALLSTVLCAGAYAQDEATQPKIDSKAEAAVKKMLEHYQEVSEASADLDFDVSASMGGMEQKQSFKYGYAVKRPNQFVLRLKEGDMGVTLVSDGEQLFTALPGGPMGQSMYTKEDAPEDFEAMLEEVGTRTDMTGSGEGRILLGIFAKDGYDILMEGVEELSFVGEEQVNDKPAQHVKLTRDEVDMDLWIAAEGEPWLVQMKPDIQKAMEEMGQPQQVDVVLTLTNWTENVSEGTFTFSPPEGAKLVESFEPQHPLTGKEAPEFTAEVYGSDEKFTLADHEGEHVVVLDFWATWCKPCVQALPILTEVTKKFADKGVVFYAVNIEEADEDVKKFFDERDLEFNVLMDREGEIASKYQVGGIPQTVIVGKDGTIKKVHVGLLPNLEKQLTKELEKYVAESGDGEGAIDDADSNSSE